MELMKTIIGVDHIGYAVKDIETAKEIFCKLGFQFGDVQFDPLRSVNVCIGHTSFDGTEGTVELLSPMDGVRSPIDGILSKSGATPYHICYRVANIKEAANEMRNEGFLPIGTIARSEPLDGDVCFLFSPDIGIIELVER